MTLMSLAGNGSLAHMQRPPALAAGRRSAAGPGAGALPAPQGGGGGTGEWEEDTAAAFPPG